MSHLLNLLIYLFSVPRCANWLLRSFRPRKGIGIPESVKIILVESVFREIFAWKPVFLALECGIPLTIGIRNPLTKNPQSSNRNPKSTALNPESKTVLDTLTWGASFLRAAIRVRVWQMGKTWINIAGRVTWQRFWQMWRLLQLEWLPYYSDKSLNWIWSKDVKGQPQKSQVNSAYICITLLKRIK